MEKRLEKYSEETSGYLLHYNTEIVSIKPEDWEYDYLETGDFDKLKFIINTNLEQGNLLAIQNKEGRRIEAKKAIYINGGSQGISIAINVHFELHEDYEYDELEKHTASILTYDYYDTSHNYYSLYKSGFGDMILEIENNKFYSQFNRYE